MWINDHSFIPRIEQLEQRMVPAVLQPIDLLVTSVETSEILRYDAEDGTFLGQFAGSGSSNLMNPIGIAEGPEGDVYATSFVRTELGLLGSVLRFNGETGNFVETTITTGRQGLERPSDLELRGFDLFIAGSQDLGFDQPLGAVFRFDLRTREFEPFIVSGSGGLPFAEGIEFGPDGLLYVSDGQNEIFRYDGVSGAIIDSFPIIFGDTSAIHGLDFGPDGNLYVAVVDFEMRTEAIFQIDVTSQTVLNSSFAQVSSPFGVVFRPDNELYVSSIANRSVELIDASTGSSIKEFVLPGSGGLTEPRYFLFREELVPEARSANLFAVNTSNELVGFNVARPSEIISRQPISGLQPGEQIVGIDFREDKNNLLYGVGDGAGGQANLYLIDTSTAQARLVADLVIRTAVEATLSHNGGTSNAEFTLAPFVLNGSEFGVTFAEGEKDGPGAFLRLTSNTGQNISIDPDFGIVLEGEPLNPDSPAGVGLGAPASTDAGIITIDSNNDLLGELFEGFIGAEPNATVSNPAPLPFDTNDLVGFDRAVFSLSQGDFFFDVISLTPADPGSVSLLGIHEDGFYRFLAPGGLGNAGGGPTEAIRSLAFLPTINDKLILSLLEDSQSSLDLVDYLLISREVAAGQSQFEAASSIIKSGIALRNIVGEAYENILGRGPDDAGLLFWVNSLRNGATLDQLKAGFFSSDEFFNNSGGTNAGFLAALYANPLGLNRSIDAPGQAFWLNELAAGSTREAVSRQILATREADENAVNLYFNDILSRDADSAGLEFFAAQLQAGVSDCEVIAALLASDERLGKL